MTASSCASPRRSTRLKKSPSRRPIRKRWAARWARCRSNSSRARAATNSTAASYEYHRNTALNSAYWFTNRDTSYNVNAAKNCGNPGSSSFNPATMVPWTRIATRRAPRICSINSAAASAARSRFRSSSTGATGRSSSSTTKSSANPLSVVRQRTILHPLAQSGVFRYGTGANAVK